MVVDAVLEDIRLCMETSLAQLNQRRIAMAKYLGELYNYQLVEANVIFRMLYAFISFGNNPDGGWGPDLIEGGNFEEGWDYKLHCMLGRKRERRCWFVSQMMGENEPSSGHTYPVA